MNNPNPSRKAGSRSARLFIYGRKNLSKLADRFCLPISHCGYMKHLNSISFGFVITFVLAGCLAAAAQGVGVFTSTSPSWEGHEGHTATLLTNGTVLIAGGFTINIYESGLPPELTTAETELYGYFPGATVGASPATSTTIASITPLPC